MSSRVYARQWNVQSEADPTKEYRVSLKQNADSAQATSYECGCAHWKFRRGGPSNAHPELEIGECKHIRAIRLNMTEINRRVQARRVQTVEEIEQPIREEATIIIDDNGRMKGFLDNI